MHAREQSDAEAERLRQALVRAMLRDGTVHRGPVERAFRRVPRHIFLPDVDLDLAYRDTSIPTKLQAGEVISSCSQPAIMAIMLEQLAVRKGQRVLEVGAGTGYNAALLAELVGKPGEVTSIDLDADTVERARLALCRAGSDRVRVEQADGDAGFGEPASYDRIIASVGMGDIPLALWLQLKPGGRLVMPLSMRGVMKSVAFRKDRRGRLTSTAISPAMFMPFRGAMPLLMREQRVGPELGLYAWSAEGRLDTDALFATLQRTDFVDIATDLRLTRRDLRTGLNFWVRAHQPAFVQVHAEGALAESAQLPPFMRSLLAHPLMRDRLSIGIWESGALALLAASSDETDPIHVVVRAWGDTGAADRLIECIRAWRAEGSPSDEQVQLRLVPHGQRSTAAATIAMSAGTLEITWARVV